MGASIALSFFSLLLAAREMDSQSAAAHAAHEKLDQQAKEARRQIQEDSADERARLWQTGELNKTRIDRHDRLLIELDLRLQQLEKEP